jgi:tRNA1Val (adenine37-N6)-methyltransferase
MNDREFGRLKLWQSLTEYQKSLLKEGERLDDLYRCGLKLIQQPRYFCIGSDAVLLADFAEICAEDRVLEAGCGNGGLLLLLYTKNTAADYLGLEIMANSAELAQRNLRLNGLEDKISIVCGDFRNLHRADIGKFDKIICNPPYSPLSACRLSSVPERAAARFELNGNLADFFQAAAKNLKPEGSFYLVIPSRRTAETASAAAAAGFFCRRKRQVLAAKTAEPLLCLWEFSLREEQTVCLPPVSITYADLVCKQHWPQRFD